jgi:hypothetical protein
VPESGDFVLLTGEGRGERLRQLRWNGHALDLGWRADDAPFARRSYGAARLGLRLGLRERLRARWYPPLRALYRAIRGRIGRH